MSYKNWTIQEEQLLEELTKDGKYSYRQMEKFFPGRSGNSLRCHARQYLDIRNNLYINHKYEKNESFFDIPNVLNCYIAGFLAADGCIQYHEKQSPTLRLEISDLDAEHLKKIKEILGYTGVIARGGSYKKTLYFNMSISEKYAQALASNFGIVPRKAHHLSPPNLNTFELRMAFLIGLLDGDGCVHIEKGNKIISVGYVSASKAAVEWAKKITDECDLFTLKFGRSPLISKLSYANAYNYKLVGARAVCLIQLIQSFYKKFNLPVLSRKWDNPILNEYIVNFKKKFPKFSYSLPNF